MIQAPLGSTSTNHQGGVCFILLISNDDLIISLWFIINDHHWLFLVLHMIIWKFPEIGLPRNHLLKWDFPWNIPSFKKGIPHGHGNHHMVVFTIIISTTFPWDIPCPGTGWSRRPLMKGPPGVSQTAAVWATGQRGRLAGKWVEHGREMLSLRGKNVDLAVFNGI